MLGDTEGVAGGGGSRAENADRRRCGPAVGGAWARRVKPGRGEHLARRPVSTPPTPPNTSTLAFPPSTADSPRRGKGSPPRKDGTRARARCQGRSWGYRGARRHLWLHPSTRACHARPRGLFSPVHISAFLARVSQELALITTSPDAALLYANLTNSTVDPKLHAAQVAYSAVRATVKKTAPKPVCKAVNECVAPALVAQESQISLLNAVGWLDNANMGTATVNGNAGNPYLSPTINYGNRENTVRFNATACLSLSYLDFGTGVRDAGTSVSDGIFEVGYWHRVKPSSNCFGISPEIADSPSCSTYCARMGKVCDPCALALAYSCADGLWNALLQSGSSDTGRIVAGQVYGDGLFTRGAPPFGGTCAGNGVSGSSNSGWNDGPGLTMEQNVCSTSSTTSTTTPLKTYFWGKPKNFWNPTQNGYLDPATACDLPFWDQTYGDPFLSSVDGLCFCTSIVEAQPRWLL